VRDRRVLAAWSVFGAVALVSSALVLRRPPDDRLSDLHIYYGAMRALRSGQPLYEYAAANGGPFTYPPFAALLLRPVTLVPEWLLRLGWLVATCAAVAAIGWAVGRALVPRSEPARLGLVVALVACGVLLSAPAQSNLRFGQVSIFVVLLALVDGMGLTPARFRGVLVGVAAAVKLTPLLFVVYFLVARRYRDAARAAGAFAACALLAAAVLPAESRTYWTATVFQTSRIGDLASLGNQSVHGMLMRLGVAPSALPLVWAALVGVLCVATLVRARRISLDGDPLRAAVLIGCASVAASPVSWTHHQVWPVLAAMLMIATAGWWRRAAGGALLVTMTVSLGAALSAVSRLRGVQFVLENARTLGVVATCAAGLGTAAAAARSSRRAVLRVATAGLAGLAFVAVLPLPAGADPTFKAYTVEDSANPRYFFYCRCPVTDAAAARFGVVRERTKVRVNGVAGAAAARLEYRSAPGGAPREIPLVEVAPGVRMFAFRSATMTHGRLVVYAADGRELATYTSELTP
jgi:alpha-1,2-mannosyltransferase